MSDNVCPMCGDPVELVRDSAGFTYIHTLLDVCEPSGGDE